MSEPFCESLFYMEKYLTKNNDKCHKDFFLNTVLLRIAPQREDELFGQMFFLVGIKEMEVFSGFLCMTRDGCQAKYRKLKYQKVEGP